jgi:small subunit ribosomal protein S14
MKKQNIKDFNKRLLVYKQEKKTLLLNFIIRSTKLSKSLRGKAQYEFLEVPSLDFSKVRVNNRCIFTSRGKSVSSSIRLSRITFKKLASEGLLLGIKKSSW